MLHVGMVVNGFEILKLIGKYDLIYSVPSSAFFANLKVEDFWARTPSSNWLVITDVFDVVIGQGKFSYVFKARRVEDKRMVALKLIKIFDMENEKQRDSCLKEVQLH